jgi:chemotaxis signal transduction protein
MKTLHPQLENTESQPGKFIVFTIADYRLALPLEYVVRVINYPDKVNPEMNKLGLIQIGSRTIRLVNFAQDLPSQENLQQPNLQPFLVIARDSQGELCGIPVDQPPDLIEIPIEKMQVLPQSDRHPAALQAASHMTVISQEKDTTTIFLLKGIDCES